MLDTFDPADPTLGALAPLSAVESVRARVTMAVRLGMLRPQEMLPSIDELAAAFDVSSATVRRALVSLASEGVVERIRGRAGGTRIVAEPPPTLVATSRSLSPYRDMIVELIEQRSVLECGLTRLAALRAAPAELRALDELVEGMDRTQSWAEFHRLDASFHRAVAAAARSAGGAVLYDRVLTELYRFYLPYDIRYLHDSNAEHRALVVALREQDTARAEDIAFAHVDELHHTMFIELSGD